MGYIIDISKYQNPSKIDYNKFCAQLDLAIIRVQYGSRTIDPFYSEHIRQMQAHKVPYGVYAFARGISLLDMAQEARDFYTRAKDYNPAFYALDVEEQSMQDMRGGVSAYITELRKHTDKKIGVYVAHNRYKDFNLDLSKADFVWIPHYGANNGAVTSTPAFYCDLHQYTSTGHIDGYSGDLDLNRLMNGRTIEFFTSVKVTPKPVNIPQYYIVQAGDTLGKIAAKFSIAGGYTALAKLNGIANPDLIKVGQKINLKPAYKPATISAGVYYTVKAGDTLSKIAANFHVAGGYKVLAALNHIPDPNKINIGQRLIIKSSAVSVSKPTAAYYTVKAGDTLSRIAAQNKTTVNDLLKLNSSIKDPNKIYVGQRIRIR